MNEEIISAVFKQYKLSDVQGIEVIGNGDVNYTYKVVAAEKKYIVKIVDAASYLKFFHLPKNELVLSINFSEEVAAAAYQHQIPTISANVFGKDRYIELSDAIVLVYPFIQGNILSQANIHDKHIKMIATLLANLHTISYDDSLRVQANSRYTIIKNIAKQLLHEKKWQQAHQLFIVSEFKYLEKLTLNVCDEINLRCDDISNSIDKELDILICHNDVKPKNILWNSLHPIIIDWEAAGNMPRMVDYLDTMLSWCTRVENNNLYLDVNMKNLFDKTYQKIAVKSEITDDVVNLLIVKWLGWLLFCLGKLSINFDIKKQKPLIEYSLQYLNLIFTNYQEFIR